MRTLWQGERWALIFTNIWEILYKLISIHYKIWSGWSAINDDGRIHSDNRNFVVWVLNTSSVMSVRLLRLPNTNLLLIELTYIFRKLFHETKVEFLIFYFIKIFAFNGTIFFSKKNVKNHVLLGLNRSFVQLRYWDYLIVTRIQIMVKVGSLRIKLISPHC